VETGIPVLVYVLCISFTIESTLQEVKVAYLVLGNQYENKGIQITCVSSDPALYTCFLVKL
jgi:hypothetical protein